MNSKKSKDKKKKFSDASFESSGSSNLNVLTQENIDALVLKWIFFTRMRKNVLILIVSCNLKTFEGLTELSSHHIRMLQSPNGVLEQFG